MSTLAIVFAIAAALCTGVIFGTDALAALVLRPAYAEIDDRSLVQIVGRTHRFGGRRLPVPGVGSVVAAAAAVVFALVAHQPGAGIAAAAGLALLLVWLILFNRISLPINKVFIAASETGETMPGARALQDRWDSIINLRATLQGAALLAFCVAIALATA
jgi:Domain of unknown function (DUF1772)